MWLLLYTAQRRSDIVGFGPHNVNTGKLTFTQVKNARNKAVTLTIPILPQLAAILPDTKSTWLLTEHGKPYTAAGFGNWFRRMCNDAGLPHCSAHGLRKAAATRLAESGASERQIMAITGHSTSKEVSRYTKAVNQESLADEAFNRL
jgi:integrase